MTFKERAVKESRQSSAKERMSADKCCPDCSESYDSNGNFQHKRGFQLGAEWGYRQAIADLRSEEAHEMWLSAYATTPVSFLPTGKHYADWLEGKLK